MRTKKPTASYTTNVAIFPKTTYTNEILTKIYTFLSLTNYNCLFHFLFYILNIHFFLLQKNPTNCDVKFNCGIHLTVKYLFLILFFCKEQVLNMQQQLVINLWRFAKRVEKNLNHLSSTTSNDLVGCSHQPKNDLTGQLLQQNTSFINI